MADIRRIIVIFVIAILFTILVNVSIDSIYPEPDYRDYCADRNEPRAVRVEVTCPDSPTPAMCEKGQTSYTYDGNGCAVESYCETCYDELDDARAKRGLFVFVVSAVVGLIALFIGLFLPTKKNELNEWVGSGFLLGGLFTIFAGTARYFGELGRVMRPLVLLVELVLVVWLVYKWLGKKKR